MPFYLAIDAGGTSTRCLLADHDRILARASTGSVKLMRVPEAEATARLHALLAEVSASAAVPLTQITRTCVGLAGITIPAVRAWALTALAARVSGEILLLGDEEIALDAAAHRDPAPQTLESTQPSPRPSSVILVIAGTGSNVIGRAPDGCFHSAGGWGPILGDEGSGYWIGLEAIRAALRAQDSAPTRLDLAEPSTQLLTAIQQHFHLDSLATLIELGNHRGDATHPAPDFAALAPIVARLAEPTPCHPANPIAAAVLHRAGSDLAAQVLLVAQKIRVPHVRPEVDHGVTPPPSPANPEPQTQPIAIAFTGSVLTHIAPVRAAMAAALAQTLPTAHLQPTPVDPLDGALYRARQA